MEKVNNTQCLLCKKQLTLAGATGIDINGYCANCGIYYNDNEPKFKQIKDTLIAL